MNLGDFEILPGIVVENADPLNQCRVKACAPGLFVSDMDTEDLMWINPFIMFGNQISSRLDIKAKIWILHNKKNYFEYWYLPMYEKNENVPDTKTDEYDVLFSRSVNGELIQAYYTREDGIKLVCGDNFLNITSEGDFKTKVGDANIIANTDGIKLYKEGDDLFSGVKGEKLVNLLSEFFTELGNTAASMSANPYTAAAGTSIIKLVNKLQPKINDIKSSFIKIS